MRELNLSKAAGIQPETFLKNKLFPQRYFARFLSGTHFSGSFRTKQPNQPSVIMNLGKLLKPVNWAQPFSVTYCESRDTLLLDSPGMYE